ncbi:hypothetical protein Htur_1549 [Haloterrigena turkmenica DSM 5511]|uniref:Uncharacterized protein n=1 Tax=Haloterrigena turkmenica (strain ATCC 51198 / DSM 5511 / JCM 9101 / NCIMB 13204 / VKM B-1734 / 4k) TaxID=543526 RepID=D2RQV4_HALTV|nr:hypothetical protein Htur_1549 [Haloterrigena turkmenica DSM 5511]
MADEHTDRDANRNDDSGIVSRIKSVFSRND